jgi:23S rRNA pseudoU1915 N3-methylase RlmH
MKKFILITVADSWHHFEKPIKEYEKRLQKELDIVLLKPVKYDDSEACRQKDTQNVIEILKKYPSSYIIFCDLGGKSFGSTEKFAEWVNIKSQKYKGIVFVI